MKAPARPPLRWHGGKWRIGRWIVQFFPEHDTYTETYGGAGSCLMQKPIAKAEIYNDLDETIVNFFRVLREPAQAARLIELLRVTPFARREFEAAYQHTDDPVERARRTVVRSFMGFGSDGTAGVYPTGFRSTVTRAKKLPSNEWATYPEALQAVVARFARVTVESRPAIAVMRQFDDVGTLHYVDPPYLPETRSSGNRRRGQGYHVYEHELDRDDHIELLGALRAMRGMVVLSGYPSDLYDETLIGWQRVQRQAFADGGRPRVECLWINAAAVAALGNGPLFEDAA